MADVVHTPSRRAMLGLFAVAPLVASMPALALPAPVSQVPALLAANRAAEARFAALPDTLERDDLAAHGAEMDRMITAYEAALEAEPATWGEFTAQLALVTDEGKCALDEHWAPQFLARARRLAGSEQA